MKPAVARRRTTSSLSLRPRQSRSDMRALQASSGTRISIREVYTQGMEIDLPPYLLCVVQLYAKL